MWSINVVYTCGPQEFHKFMLNPQQQDGDNTNNAYGAVLGNNIFSISCDTSPHKLLLLKIYCDAKLI